MDAFVGILKNKTANKKKNIPMNICCSAAH